MYHVSAQGVDERMINVHCYYYCLILSPPASPILPPVTGLLVLVAAGWGGGGGPKVLVSLEAAYQSCVEIAVQEKKTEKITEKMKADLRHVGSC